MPQAQHDETSGPQKPRLSPRMVEVLALVATGMTHDQTAAKLGISSSAVRSYITSARGRLRARSRSEAIAIAVASGLINVSPTA